MAFVASVFLNIENELHRDTGKVRRECIVDAQIMEGDIYMKLFQFEGGGILPKRVTIVLIKSNNFFVSVGNFNPKLVMDLLFG